MATLEEWKSAGVDLRTYISTSGDLVLPSTETPVALNPGGPSGVPSGWVLYLSNPGTMPNNWSASTSSGIFRVGNQTPGYNAISVGGYYRGITVDPTKWYQLKLKGRLQAAHNDTRMFMGLQARNPLNGQYFALEYVNDEYPTTEWRMYSCTQDKNIPAQYTQLEIVLTGSCKNLNEGSTYNWGCEWTELVIVAFDKTSSEIVWRDVTCDVQTLSWRYGRERFTNRYDVATINALVQNPEGRYSYASPHPDNLEPGRLLKVEATYEGVTYPQAYGVIDQLQDAVTREGKAATQITALDPTTIFSNRSTPTLPGTNTADKRLTEVMKYLGYPRFLTDVGVWTMQEIQSSGRSLRDELGVTADSEGGSVFADRQGNIVYKNRNWITTDDRLTKVGANLWAKPESDQPYFDHTPDQPDIVTICLASLQTDWGMSRVVNLVDLANAGGTAEIYQDLASQKKRGPRTYSRHDFVLDDFYSDMNNWLQIRANDIMNGYTEPKLRLNRVTYRPGIEENDWTYTLRVFLNWLVRVWYQNAVSGTGWLIVTHIQSIEHRVTPTDWETTLSLDLPTYYADAPVQNVIAWDQPGAKWDTTAVWV